MSDQDELMEGITGALETPPAATVPDDFTARLMARLPPTRRHFVLPELPVRPQYGLIATSAGIVLLLIAMAFAAVFAQTSPVLETVLFCQFCGLTLWLAVSRRRVF